MFGFQVVHRFDPGAEGPTRVGSVVTMPQPLGIEMVVGVMWDDDLTFEVLNIEMLQAVGTLAGPKKEKPDTDGNVVPFPKGKPDPDTKH